MKLRDYGLTTEKLEDLLNQEKPEDLVNEDLIVEYARVSTQASSDIAAYDKEIEGLLSHKGDLERLIEASKLAEDRGAEVAKLLEELNSQGISVLLRTDFIWVEFVLDIQPLLTKRTTEIKGALERIGGRLENLKDLRNRANALRGWVDYFWWYEAFRQSAVQHADSAVPGMTETGTASDVGGNAGSHAGNAMAKLLSDAQAATAITDDIVEQLRKEGAKKDSDAAKSARIQQFLGVASTVLSSGDTIGGAISKRGEASSTTPRIKFDSGEVNKIAPPKRNPPAPKTLSLPQRLPDKLPENPGPVINWKSKS